MRPVELRELMSIHVNVMPLVDLGGRRRFVPFAGGTFEGREDETVSRGSILQGGVDWQTVRLDGTLDIDAHYTLLTEEDEAIEVVSQGLRRGLGGVSARRRRRTAYEAAPSSASGPDRPGGRGRMAACSPMLFNTAGQAEVAPDQEEQLEDLGGLEMGRQAVPGRVADAVRRRSISSTAVSSVRSSGVQTAAAGPSVTRFDLRCRCRPASAPMRLCWAHS